MTHGVCVLTPFLVATLRGVLGQDTQKLLPVLLSVVWHLSNNNFPKGTNKIYHYAASLTKENVRHNSLENIPVAAHCLLLQETLQM